jgi:hypothetical protein
VHVALPEGRKAHVAPSVSALPKRVMAAATLAKMVVGTRVRSGGEGGDEGGGGEGGGRASPWNKVGLMREVVVPSPSCPLLL